MTPQSYGRTLEIDHIVSLELGGSNGHREPLPGEGERESRLPRQRQAREQAPRSRLRGRNEPAETPQRQIAKNWQLLFRKVYGTAPTG